MKTILSLILFLVSFSASASLVHLPKNKAPDLFRLTESYEYDYPVMSGKIVYQSERDELFSEGYHISESIKFSGKRLVKVYDYDSRLSVEFILNRIASSLQQQGYFIEFECYTVECGEPEALPAFFGNLMNSEEDRYGYQLFSRNLRNDDMISIYAVLIDSKVRVLMNIFGESPDTRYINLNTDFPKNEFQGLTVYFAPSSTILTDSSIKLIRDFLDKLDMNSANKLLIQGHSDRTGSAQANKAVSVARAKSVHQLVNGVYGKTGCDAQGYGATRPYFYSPPTSDGITDRRVEIIVLKSSERC